MKRYYHFDLLRIVALGLILSCHFIRDHGFYLLDIPLGCVGNLLFFIMSGWLLGLGWSKKGEPILGLDFLRHRLLRLAVPLWLFVVPWLIYLRSTGFPVSARDVILSLTLGNWFARLPGLTSLWFVTAIAVFYFILVAISQFPIRRINSFVLVGCLLGTVLFVQLACVFAGFRFCYILTLAFCGVSCFICAESMASVLRKVRLAFSVVLLFILAMFGLFWYLVWNGDILVGTSVCYWLSALVAFAIVILVFTRDEKPCSWMASLSSMSYEIYLVHRAVFAFVEKGCQNLIICACTCLTFSILSGWLLHCLANKIFKAFKKA